VTSSVILWVFAIAGLLTLLLKTIGELRDKALDDGWLTDKSWLGRTRRRALQRRIEPALSAVGITADHFDALRSAAADQAAKRRATDTHLRSRPDRALVSAIKPWIVRLDDGSFRGNDHYVDTMGLVHHRSTGRPSLAAIADSWVSVLEQHGEVDSFDCVITLKEGNPVLVTEFCNRVSPARLVKPILCKSKRDPARVGRDSGSHETDFEGLRAFLDAMGPPSPPRTRYRALALDDNCTSGRSLYAAIEEFNDFVSARSDDYPIEPITQAAVLFVVLAGKEDDFAFAGTAVALHAMLALGSTEMRQIEETKMKAVPELADQMKNHPACVLSASLGTLTEASTPIPAPSVETVEPSSKNPFQNERGPDEAE
jgi:hypothetical protein